MLRPFAFLFNTFWDEEQEVRVFGYKPNYKILNDLPSNFVFYSIDRTCYPADRWSDGLIQLVRILQVEHFILFLEDFWLYDNVCLNQINSLVGYMFLNKDVLRMDLTNERISKKGAQIIEHFDGIGIVDAGLPSKYSMSFQVGIWNSELALKVLQEGETPWKAEINGTKRVNAMKGELRVLGTDKRPVRYQPVYRNHKRQLKIDKIPTHLMNVIMKRGWLDG
jgi:hypothetical protein